MGPALMVAMDTVSTIKHLTAQIRQEKEIFLKEFPNAEKLTARIK